ncbi:discoidin domain-containing protein [Pedobacter sp. N36a]|uniref:discoidin domain-containing protein n=1 Tax=Pedobacter sp. N36a TaxID=2767996 RepID=UPI0016572468|nr:discoidin domain-containing protein [Pedobacter sp. N36a]MBC8986299.1 discoidin domain-containing protein [Pedobacter sp. N36a]
MKRKCLYLFMVFAVAAISCKKSSVAPVIEVIPVPVEVTEDPTYINVANSIAVSSEMDGAKFEWSNSSKKAVDILVKYNQDGLRKEHSVKNNQDATGSFTLPISEMTNFTILVNNTAGKLAETRLIGIVPILKPEVKLTKIGWTASASSEINDADNEFNGAENIVDDLKRISLSSPGVPSFWQSDYNAEPMYIYPHWLIVDMKTASRLTKVGLNAHVDATQGFTNFILEGSVDGVKYTEIGAGSLAFNPAIKTEQLYPVVTTEAIRYVKITLRVGSPYPCLANFEAYSRK